MKALVLLADGFEEIETTTIVDVLRRGNVDVTVASLREGEILGSRKMKMVADTSLDEIKLDDFQMLVLPGGQPGVDNLRASKQVLELVKQVAGDSSKWLGAICAAPLILRDAGVLEGRKITSYPAVEEALGECDYSQETIVVDGNLITSRGPATAMEFALKLLEVLQGGQVANEVAEGMLVVK